MGGSLLFADNHTKVRDFVPPDLIEHLLQTRQRVLLLCFRQRSGKFDLAFIANAAHACGRNDRAIDNLGFLG